MEKIIAFSTVLLIGLVARADINCNITETLSLTKQTLSYQITDADLAAMTPKVFALKLITQRQIILSSAPDKTHYFVEVESGLHNPSSGTEVSMVTGSYDMDWYGLAGAGDLSVRCTR